MDQIQNKIDDFLQSPNDIVVKIAEEKTNMELKEKYPGGYNDEIRNNILQKNIVIARQEVLEKMKFEQAYEDLRHKGDLSEEQKIC